MYDNQRYVITAMYLRKRKLMELRRDKTKVVFRGKSLTDPSLFPLLMQDNELGWKYSLVYVVATDKFMLSIDGVNFFAYPYQAEIIVTGPQNIESGVIKINGQLVHEGFKQYTYSTV